MKETFSTFKHSYRQSPLGFMQAEPLISDLALRTRFFQNTIKSNN